MEEEERCAPSAMISRGFVFVLNETTKMRGNRATFENGKKKMARLHPWKPCTQQVIVVWPFTSDAKASAHLVAYLL